MRYSAESEFQFLYWSIMSRYGFDSWQDPIAEVTLEEVAPGLLVTEPLALNRPPDPRLRHYRVEGHETYNEGLLPLVRELGPGAARQVLGDTARRVFGVPL